MVPVATSFHGARPLRADARRNRDRIVSAAHALFAQAGREVQMEDIAGRAGVGIGTLYRHFPTKEALLTEMVRERFEEMAELAVVAEQTTEPYAALAQLITAQAEAVSHDKGFQLAMMGTSQLDWQRIEPSKAGLNAAVSRIIERAVAANAVRSDLTLDDYGMLMCGLCATMHFSPDRASWRRHLRLLLAGLRPVSETPAASQGAATRPGSRRVAARGSKRAATR